MGLFATVRMCIDVGRLDPRIGKGSVSDGSRTIRCSRCTAI